MGMQLEKKMIYEHIFGLLIEDTKPSSKRGRRHLEKRSATMVETLFETWPEITYEEAKAVSSRIAQITGRLIIDTDQDECSRDLFNNYLIDFVPSESTYIQELEEEFCCEFDPKELRVIAHLELWAC